MKHPQEVFDNHIKAVYTLDPSIVIKDYADDALFITPEKTYKGVGEILAFYKDLLSKMEDFRIEPIKQETHNYLVYLVWQGKNKNIDVQLATDTYIIKEGKIQYHTFTGIIN